MSRRRVNQKSNLQALSPSAAQAGTQSVSQVRIIGGRFKRQMVAFVAADGLRPTPDRLRETVFNWVQFELHDAWVLDVCAGSGVLGFEALSRGAAYATFIERHPKQAQLLKQTALQLKLAPGQFAIYNGDALNILPQLGTLPSLPSLPSPPQSALYHLVFIDPPYDLMLWVPLIKSLITHQLINAESFIYIEDRRPLPDTLSDLGQGYTLLKQVQIGQIYASLIQVAII